MKISCLWSSNRQRRRSGSLSRGDEASEEVSYNWSVGVQILDVLGVKAQCKKLGSKW